jgi:virginiamycin A acetyltransferase
MPLSPDLLHPMPGQSRLVFLKNCITSPAVMVGDYTYYDDPDGPEHFQERNVLYHFPFLGDKLVIGKFCAIGTQTKFIMNGGNHRLDGFSSYPFAIFGPEYQEAIPEGGFPNAVGIDVQKGRG